ncbi:proline-rich extensin-like protein EPR1 [Coffea eugenioides]|uniref:proline-rich extensin-like protein EPR1 n=1 Tax=Coffea eugenioides TaxID=49369 RepID=UPI000F60AEAE|nr:proline-rich extensin-like protein EPR1 [Coffea eugenioides]
MGIPQFRREGWLGFYLTLLLALSLCHGKHVQVKIVGSTECARCTSDVVKTWHPTSSGARLAIECKSPDGNFRTLGKGDFDAKGNFEINFLEADMRKKECYLKLHSSSGAPCPVQLAKRILAVMLKSIDNPKQTSATTPRLKFSSNSCIAAISRMSYESNPVESSSPRQSKNGNIERLPPTFTEYIKPLQPTPQLKQNLARPPVSVSRKLLTHPIQIFPPIIPPLVPAIHYPFPALAPLVGIPFPTPEPIYQKPLPPSANSPEPIIQKPYPPLAPTYQKPLPPSANSPMPIIHKPYPPPAPKFKKSSPPPLPVEKPNDPANPPIFISPASLPQPNPSHEQAPSPLSNVRPSPSSATPSNSFSPFPRAPPIPALPPIPTVPRRYFNLPKSGHKSPTPPTKSHS